MTIAPDGPIAASAKVSPIFFDTLDFPSKSDEREDVGRSRLGWLAEDILWGKMSSGLVSGRMAHGVTKQLGTPRARMQRCSPALLRQ